jgi:putative DNA primase/helicase
MAEVNLLTKDANPIQIATWAYKEIRDHYLILKIEETGELVYYRDGVFIRGLKAINIIEEVIYDWLKEACDPLLPTEYMIRHVKRGLNSEYLVSRNEFDKDENRINIVNGSYICHKDVRYFTDYFKFNQNPYKSFIKIPIVYDQLAECPNILKFIREVFGEDREELILQMIGYLMFPNTKFQKAFVIHGVADSGKTTFIDLGKRFKRANTRDKLVNIYDDLSFHKKIQDLSVFKTIVTNPSLSGELKHIQALGTWRNYCKQVFTCNQLPPIPLNTGDELWRRIILISCDKKVKNRDRNILDKITTQEELSGLLNLALKAYEKLLYQDGFSEEWENIDYIEGRWNINSTPIKLFIEEECVKEGETEVKHFRDVLNAFRRELVTYELTQNKITRELDKIGVYKKRRRDGDYYIGISIKNEETGIEKIETFI